MLLPRRDDAETPADHWKNHLSQKTSRLPTREDFNSKPNATARGRRRWSVVLRNFVIGAFFCTVVAVGVYAWNDTAAEPPAPPSSAEIEFKTDGVITEKWIREIFKDEAKLPPIFDIQRRLSEVPQIREVTVRRMPGGKLSVSIAERRPVMRFMAKLPDGSVGPRLVSSEGVVYEGINVGQMTYANLPFIEGMTIRKDKNYDVIDGFAPVSAFLDLAREKYPAVYRDWLKVSLRDYPGRPDAPGSVLRVKPRLNTQSPDAAAIKEIVFSPADYAVELETLADRGFADMLNQALRTVDRSKFPAYRLDLSMVNAANPRRPVPEPRLVPVPVDSRQP